MPAVLDRSPTLTTPAPMRSRVVSRPMPRPEETQLQFVDRCMRSVTGDTDRRNAVALAAWADSGRESDLERIANQKFPGSKYRRVRNRCVFAEHSRKRMVTDPHTGQQTEQLETYDRDALAAIVDRCNDRILDTGDFAPITEGHTPDEEARIKGAAMPAVLGYAGPFRLGVIGNRKPRYAIFCDEFHAKADVPKLDRLARRSPEVWVEDRMEDRFFDPIAALGAETPRLDMGMSLYALRDGRRVEKYSAGPIAAMPSGSNTFLPSDHGERRRESKNQAGESSMLSPEDVKSVVDALMQTEQMQWVTQQMGAANAPSGGDAGGPPDAGAPDMGAPPPDAGAPPAAPEAPPAMPPQEPDQNAMRYECDDDDKSMMSRYMAGEMGEDEAGEYLKQKREQYMADASVSAPNPGNPTDSSSVATPPVSESYSRRQGDLQVRYHRVEKENRELRARVETIERKERATYRRNKLLEKAQQGYVFDLDDELTLTSDYSDKQFDRHVAGVIEKYERAPVGIAALPTPDIQQSVTDRQKQRNAAERSAKIQKYTLEQREKGNNVSWEEAARHIEQMTA